MGRHLWGRTESDTTEATHQQQQRQVCHSFFFKEQVSFNFTAAVILEPKKIKSVTVFIVFPSICHEVMGPDAVILSFLNVEF